MTQKPVDAETARIQRIEEDVRRFGNNVVDEGCFKLDHKRDETIFSAREAMVANYEGNFEKAVRTNVARSEGRDPAYIRYMSLVGEQKALQRRLENGKEAILSKARELAMSEMAMGPRDVLAALHQDVEAIVEVNEDLEKAFKWGEPRVRALQEDIEKTKEYIAQANAKPAESSEGPMQILKEQLEEAEAKLARLYQEKVVDLKLPDQAATENYDIAKQILLAGGKLTQEEVAKIEPPQSE